MRTSMRCPATIRTDPPGSGHRLGTTALAAAACAFLLVSALPAGAAVTALDAWTNLLTNTNPGTVSYTTTTTNTFTMSAGTNRVALVGVCLEASTGGVTITSIDVRLDSSAGTQFTEIARSSGSQREHCYLGRLLDAQVSTGTHAVYLNTTISANTITGVHIWAGTYRDVDQTTPVTGSAANNSAATNVAFGTAVAFAANSMTAYIVAGGNTATAVTHVTGFASAGQSWSTDQSTSIAQATNATSGTWASTSTVTWTGTATRSAIAAASLNPASASPPGAPGTPTYSNIATTSVTVSWTSGTGATSHNLQRATDSGFTTNLTTFTGVTSPYNDTGPLTGNTTYWYRAVAVNAAGSTTGTGSSVTTLPNPPGAPGTPTYSAIASTSVTVSWTSGTGATSHNLQRATDSAFTLNLTTLAGVTSPYPDSGLTASTTYWYRAVAVNSGGSTTGTGSSVTTLAPENRVIPGVPTATANSCSQVTASAPFSGDANGNSTTTFTRGTAPTGPFSVITSCATPATGTSPRTCVDTAVAASTTYYYQVTFTDTPDGVVGTNPQVTAAVTTPACTANNTTIGTISAVNASCNSIMATATFTGDANATGTTTFEYNTSNTWPGTASCTVSGPSPRVCTITGLVSPNTYWVRATFADTDGVVGTNPTTGVSTGAALPACGADTTPPTVTILSPARNAVIGGTETVKVQAFDAVAMNATPVLFSVDGAALSATGVTVSANYACDGSGPPGKCKVYLFDVNTTLLANGPHYLTVQAVDASNNRTTLSWGFRANNTGSAAAGSGQVLRRTKGSQLCQDCHALETHSSQYTTTNYGNWSFDCLGCHTSHATTNIYLVKPGIDTPNSGSKPVDFRNTTGVATNSYATPQASGNGVNVCEVCHTKTKNSDATARARNNAPTDWTKHYTGRCTTCHAHKEGFAAGESGGGVACAGCHSGIWNRMQAAGGSTYRHTLGLSTAADDTATWGSPLNAVAAAARSCVNMCHDDHPHTATDDPSPTLHYNLAYKDATSNASRAAATRTVATKAKTDFDNSLPNGGLCVSCHRNPVESGTTPAHPAVAQAAYASSAHNTTSTTPGGAWQFTLHDGSNFVRNCTKCHWDSADGTTPTVSGATAIGAVHGNTNPSLLMGTTNPAGAPAAFVCYRCHGGGATGADYSSKAAYQDGGKAYKHPTDADTVHVSTTEFYNAAWGNTLGVTGRHANCLDCHEPHGAKPTAPLVQYTTGTATATSGGTAVTGSGTTWTSTHVGWRIKNNTVGVWHTVTAVGGATSITIGPGATAAWSGAYTLEAKPNFYNVGTATFTLNSTAVTGTGTSWSSAYVGWSIRSTTNTLYQIASVNSPTSLTLTANYATANLTSAYTIAAGNVAGPGLQGVWGAQLSSNPALWTAPGSGNFTKKTITAGTDLEATLCFKCHSSYYWGAGSPPNGLSPNGSATTPVETDIAMEFNPNNRSGHPVLASLNNFAGSTAPKALAAGQMLPPWNAALGTQTMTCSDCHNTDAASPAAQGPHGSAVTFMLRNADKKPGWPTASATAAGFATTICSDCHVNANIHTRDGAHGACYLCHIVIPHGGKMSRLIGDRDAASLMPARYAYNNDKNTMNVQSFTKAGSDSGYITSNCQATCTTTHGTAASENW